MVTSRPVYIGQTARFASFLLFCKLFNIAAISVVQKWFQCLFECAFGDLAHLAEAAHQSLDFPLCSVEWIGCEEISKFPCTDTLVSIGVKEVKRRFGVKLYFLFQLFKLAFSIKNCFPDYLELLSCLTREVLPQISTLARIPICSLLH